MPQLRTVATAVGHVVSWLARSCALINALTAQHQRDDATESSEEPEDHSRSGASARCPVSFSTTCGICISGIARRRVQLIAQPSRSTCRCRLHPDECTCSRISRHAVSRAVAHFPSLRTVIPVSKRCVCKGCLTSTIHARTLMLIRESGPDGQQECAIPWPHGEWRRSSARPLLRGSSPFTREYPKVFARHSYSLRGWRSWDSLLPWSAC